MYGFESSTPPALPPGEIARRSTERWLSRALRSGLALPRIPLRRVEEGGFERLMAQPRGPEAVAKVWNQILDKVPLE